MTNIYSDPEHKGNQALLDAVANDDIESLIEGVIAASLYEEDFQFVQRICIQLSSHHHYNVRGNAVLGFGHLARRFGELRDDAIEIVRAALHDTSDYVQGQADAAASDIKHFLGINVFPEGQDD